MTQAVQPQWSGQLLPSRMFNSEVAGYLQESNCQLNLTFFEVQHAIDNLKIGQQMATQEATCATHEAQTPRVQFQEICLACEGLTAASQIHLCVEMQQCLHGYIAAGKPQHGTSRPSGACSLEPLQRQHLSM